MAAASANAEVPGFAWRRPAHSYGWARKSMLVIALLVMGIVMGRQFFYGHPIVPPQHQIAAGNTAAPAVPEPAPQTLEPTVLNPGAAERASAPPRASQGADKVAVEIDEPAVADAAVQDAAVQDALNQDLDDKAASDYQALRNDLLRGTAH